jgi:capsular polysaccharide transport system ATP-binding protein
MIRLESVTKSYKVPRGRHVVLDQVSFTLPERCRLGIFGANGTGKSALLRIIAGGEMPDSGRIVREGRVSFPVGFTGTFHPLLSARENVSFLARVYGMAPEEVVEWIESFAELGRYFDMPVGTYSSGMYARIAFATSFAFDFDVYLVDEVIEVGDARFRAKCAAAFEERMKTASLILVSQHVSTIRQFCNLAAVLHEGKLSRFVPIDDALGMYEQHLRLTSLAGSG